MLSTAIVIFRETLEISLILGIVLAATRGLQGRLLWIAGGFAAGGAGAGLVAFFAEAISNAAQGVGQELFNACILFTAALFIGWTVIWMRKHAREVSAELKKVGQDVTSGKLPRYSLTVIIGLAMLREGSEIVLFIYGMILSGESASTITLGSILGIISGTAAGMALYFGLIKLPVKQMLQYTSWLLMLLVAGLAAQGVGFLTAAGYFDSLSSPVWDTSWLLSDGSVAGKALHTLIGYSAKPSGIQIIFYAAALALLMTMVSIIDGKLQPRTAIAVGASGLMFALITFSSPAFAIDDIQSPNIVKGELELEYNANKTIDDRHDENNIQAHEIELEYGVTERWKTELSTVIAKEPDEDAKVDEVAFENFIQFWDQGEKFVDAGAQLAIAHNFTPHEPDAIEAKLLLEKQTGPFLHRANIGLEQEVGAGANGGPDLSFLWSSRYRMGEHFEPGFELQSDFGQDGAITGSSDKQEHYLGPSAYGEIVPGVKYEAAYLFGLSDASTDAAMRLKLEFEKFF